MEKSHIFYRLVFILITNLLVSFAQDCKPFGVRLNFGNYFSNGSTQKLAIRFNTKSSCQRSFVTVQKGSSINKIYCDNFALNFDQYTTYVQKCPISDILEGQSIQYIAFGWTGNVSDPQIPYKSISISYYFPKFQDEFKMISLADWSYLRDMRNKYRPLDDSFDYLLRNDKDIRAIFINGDVAYDLQTGNGRNYEDFLNMLSQVSIKWPVIINAGNHEHRDDNSRIMTATFQTYGIIDKRTVQLKLPWFNFIMFDPYQILYNKQQQSISYGSYRNQLEKAYNSKNLTILASHYPFRCNGQPSDCVIKHQKISMFYNAMFQINAPLYLGAHHHAYQRHYPFQSDGGFTKKQRTTWSVDAPAQSRSLISIVEGVGGNDVFIEQGYDHLEDFTAAVSYNVTGFGLLKINQERINYKHYSTNDVYRPVDQLQIILRRRPSKQLRFQ